MLAFTRVFRPVSLLVIIFRHVLVSFKQIYKHTHWQFQQQTHLQYIQHTRWQFKNHSQWPVQEQHRLETSKTLSLTNTVFNCWTPSLRETLCEWNIASCVLGFHRAGDSWYKVSLWPTFYLLPHKVNCLKVIKCIDYWQPYQDYTVVLTLFITAPLPSVLGSQGSEV